MKHHIVDTKTQPAQQTCDHVNDSNTCAINDPVVITVLFPNQYI